jgi:hypothetical protein
VSETSWKYSYGVRFSDGTVDMLGTVEEGSPDFTDPERRAAYRAERADSIRMMHLTPTAEADVTFVRRRRTLTIGELEDIVEEEIIVEDD